LHGAPPMHFTHFVGGLNLLVSLSLIFLGSQTTCLEANFKSNCGMFPHACHFQVEALFRWPLVGAALSGVLISFTVPAEPDSLA
jgi:hypothetical protein